MGDERLIPAIDPVKLSLVGPIGRLTLIRQTLRNLNTLLPWLFENKKVMADLKYLSGGLLKKNVDYSNYWSLAQNHSVSLDHLLDRSAVVLGVELSPGFKQYLDEREVTYIDVRLSPLRFGSDLLLRVDSNKFSDVLSSFSVSHSILVESANAWKEYAIEKAGPHTILYLQKKWDFALLTETGFVSDVDVLEAIEEARTNNESVLVVSHPFSKPSVEAVNFIRIRSNFAFDNDLGAYQSFARFQSSTHAAFSSSILEEAPYFGCKFERIGGGINTPGHDLTNKGFLRMLLKTGLISRQIEVIDIQPIRYTLGLDWSRTPRPSLPPL